MRNHRDLYIHRDLDIENNKNTCTLYLCVYFYFSSCVIHGCYETVL